MLQCFPYLLSSRTQDYNSTCVGNDCFRSSVNKKDFFFHSCPDCTCGELAHTHTHTHTHTHKTRQNDQYFATKHTIQTQHAQYHVPTAAPSLRTETASARLTHSVLARQCVAWTRRQTTSLCTISCHGVKAAHAVRGCVYVCVCVCMCVCVLQK